MYDQRRKNKWIDELDDWHGGLAMNKIMKITKDQHMVDPPTIKVDKVVIKS
jgi:hypothetical protein